MPLNKLIGVLRPSCGLTSLSTICPSYGKLHQNLAFSYKDHTNSLKKKKVKKCQLQEWTPDYKKLVFAHISTQYKLFQSYSMD